MNRRGQPPRRAQSGDQGNIAIEFVMWVPAAMILLMIAMVAGRIVTAGSAVDAAAADAAREASISRTADEATTQARGAAAATLEDEKLKCTSTKITLDTSGFSAPLGTYGAVTATVRCTVKLTDLGPLKVGNKTVTSSFTSVIDRYRQR